jgi:hypothetical protein
MSNGFNVEGFVTIRDFVTKEILVEKKNAIHHENMSLALANALSSRGKGEIYRMAFGNGASSVDETGAITYLPPNSTGQNAALYNQTYSKIVDDTSVLNTDAAKNKMSVSHISGKVYTDVVIKCLLDYGEPAGQSAFDNTTSINSQFTFDEIGILVNYGNDNLGNELTKLIAHVIFHPVQKSLNRQYEVEYIIRIQSLTNMITI